MTGRRLLSVSRQALKRVFYLSTMYRLEGDKRYSDRAVSEMLALCRFSDWNPSHFLDVGEMTMAVSIGYDWLHEVMSEAERAEIRESILSKGLPYSLTVSVGIGKAEKGRDLQAVIEEADARLYEEKKNNAQTPTTK